jgi:hypothetical protein
VDAHHGGQLQGHPAGESGEILMHLIVRRSEHEFVDMMDVGIMNQLHSAWKDMRFSTIQHMGRVEIQCKVLLIIAPLALIDIRWKDITRSRHLLLLRMLGHGESCTGKKLSDASFLLGTAKGGERSDEGLLVGWRRR